PEQGKVELNLLDDAGTPHLDHDVVAGGEQAAVRLGDGSGRERLRLEAHERIGAEVLPHDRLDLFEGDGGHVVDEPAELVDVDVRQEVWARRKELPELDERRAELFETLTERLRSLARRLATAGHADLGEDPAKPALVCDPPDGQRAASTLETCAHGRVIPPLATWETPVRA